MKNVCEGITVSFGGGGRKTAETTLMLIDMFIFKPSLI